MPNLLKSEAISQTSLASLTLAAVVLMPLSAAAQTVPAEISRTIRLPFESSEVSPPGPVPSWADPAKQCAPSLDEATAKGEARGRTDRGARNRAQDACNKRLASAAYDGRCEILCEKSGWLDHRCSWELMGRKIPKKVIPHFTWSSVVSYYGPPLNTGHDLSQTYVTKTGKIVSRLFFIDPTSNFEAKKFSAVGFFEGLVTRSGSPILMDGDPWASQRRLVFLTPDLEVLSQVVVPGNVTWFASRADEQSIAGILKTDASIELLTVNSNGTLKSRTLPISVDSWDSVHRDFRASDDASGNLFVLVRGRNLLEITGERIREVDLSGLTSWGVDLLESAAMGVTLATHSRDRIYRRQADGRFLEYRFDHPIPSESGDRRQLRTTFDREGNLLAAGFFSIKPMYGRPEYGTHEYPQGGQVYFFKNDELTSGYRVIGKNYVAPAQGAILGKDGQVLIVKPSFGLDKANYIELYDGSGRFYDGVQAGPEVSFPPGTSYSSSRVFSLGNDEYGSLALDRRYGKGYGSIEDVIILSRIKIHPKCEYSWAPKQ